jgi:hypothetical protein
LGIVRVAQKDLEKAIAGFQSAILCNPDYAFAYNLEWQLSSSDRKPVISRLFLQLMVAII